MTTFESRWGHHPVCHSDFLILKALHKRHWEAIRARAAWERWYAKEPQNRVIRKKIRNEEGWVIRREVVGKWEEPAYDPDSILQQRRLYKRCTKGGVGKMVTEGSCIVTDFRNARYPKPTPDDVTPVDMAPYKALYKQLQEC